MTRVYDFDGRELVTTDMDGIDGDAEPVPIDPSGLWRVQPRFRVLFDRTPLGPDFRIVVELAVKGGAVVVERSSFEPVVNGAVVDLASASAAWASMPTRIKYAVELEAGFWSPATDNWLAELKERDWASPDGMSGYDEAAQEAAMAARVRRVAGAATRRRRITDDDLREVLALHEAGGITRVMDEKHYSERNARRLLSRARRELT